MRHLLYRRKGFMSIKMTVPVADWLKGATDAAPRGGHSARLLIERDDGHCHHHLQRMMQVAQNCGGGGGHHSVHTNCGVRALKRMVLKFFSASERESSL